MSTELAERPANLPSTNGVDTFALAVMSDQDFERRLSALKQGRARVQAIQREIMQEDVDYGTIPGTPKPTLYKSGAETLCVFHGLVARMEVQYIPGDGRTAPHLTYDATCFLHLGTTDGPVVGTGHGTANSWERRYRYRRGERTCPTCSIVGAVIKGKAEYGGGWKCWAKKGGCGAAFRDGDPAIESQQIGDVENPDPFDLAVTLLKMAEKRAHVDATLRATGTSGLFTQDVEDGSPAPEDRTGCAHAATELRGDEVVCTECGTVMAARGAPRARSAAPKTKGEALGLIADAAKAHGVSFAGIEAKAKELSIDRGSASIEDLMRLLGAIEHPGQEAVSPLPAPAPEPTSVPSVADQDAPASDEAGVAHAPASIQSTEGGVGPAPVEPEPVTSPPGDAAPANQSVPAGQAGIPPGSQPAPFTDPASLGTYAAMVLGFETPQPLKDLTPAEFDQVWSALEVDALDRYAAFYNGLARPIRQALMAAQQSPRHRKDQAKANPRPDAEALRMGLES